MRQKAEIVLNSSSFFDHRLCMPVFRRMIALLVAAWGWAAFGLTISFTDLNPSGATSSGASGVNGNQQVGYALINGGLHAALWSGTSGSFVDLHPSSENYSIARAVFGSRQGGFIATVSGNAALWSGTTASFLNLNPGGSSDVYGMDREQKVGNVSFGGPPQAVLWSGTSASYVILHPQQCCTNVFMTWHIAV